MNKYADRQSFSRQKSITSVSSSLGTSYGSATETSVADVGKRKPCGYLTLLDISMLGGFSIPESSILPDTEFVPNSFHQQSHLSRWRSFVNETPKVCKYSVNMIIFIDCKLFAIPNIVEHSIIKCLL